MTGFVLLHRSLLAHPLWTRQRFTQGQAWVDLILSASHADHQIPMGTKLVSVKRGEVLTSQVKLAARWRWDRETVRRFFRALGSLNMIRIRTSKESETGYTIVSIVNYDLYQGDGQQLHAAMTESIAPSEAPSDPASVPHPCPTINNGNKKREGPASRPSRSRGNGRTPEGYQEALEHWFREFERTRGASPQFDAAEGASLKRLLATHSLQQVKAVMTHLLTRTRLRFIREGHRYSIRTIVGAWNELWGELRQRSAEEGEALP